jgi:hypothetical protein
MTKSKYVDPCDIEGYHGRCHEGHKRCMRERRRIKALTGQILRSKKVASPKAVSGRQRVAAPDDAGHGSGGMVQEVPRTPPVQREGPAEHLLRQIFERPDNDPMAVPDNG